MASTMESGHCVECRVLWSGCSKVLPLALDPYTYPIVHSCSFGLMLCYGKNFLFVCLAYLPLSICLVSSSTWPVLSRMLAAASFPTSFSLALCRCVRIIVAMLTHTHSRSEKKTVACFLGQFALVIDCRHTFAILLQAPKMANGKKLEQHCFLATLIASETKHLRQPNHRQRWQPQLQPQYQRQRQPQL